MTDVMKKSASVVKNYKDRPFGKAFASHEYRILKKLSGLEGIPRVISLTDSTLEISFIDGAPIQTLPEPLPHETYFKLENLLNEIHKRKIVHLDLRHRKNILISENGDPFILDFESSLDLSRIGFLFDLLRYFDKAGILRIKNRHFPTLVTREDRRFLKLFNLFRPLFFLKPFKLRDKDKI